MPCPGFEWAIGQVGEDQEDGDRHLGLAHFGKRGEAKVTLFTLSLLLLTRLVLDLFIFQFASETLAGRFVSIR